MITDEFREELARDMADQARRPARTEYHPSSWDELPEVNRGWWRSYADVVVARVCERRFGGRNGLEYALRVALGAAAEIRIQTFSNGGKWTLDAMVHILADFIASEGLRSDAEVTLERARITLRRIMADEGQGAPRAAGWMLDLLDEHERADRVIWPAVDAPPVSP